MARRIDSLNKGETVTIRFHGSKQFGNDPYELQMKFVEVTGSGDKRNAHFDDNGANFEAYRFNGHWAYGTSAEKLSLIV